MSSETTTHDDKTSSGGGTAGSNGPFQDPVFKKLSLLNGAVNKLTKDQMKEKLAQLHLDTRGQKDVLKKRLKSYYKRKMLPRAQGPQQKKRPHYDYFMVIDFEATCDRVKDYNYPHEIIEFPVVLVDATDGSMVDEFHSYVKPAYNSRLSEFCRELTSITQEQVDSAPSFPEVLHNMEEWMHSHQLGKGRKVAVVTDGPWDMSRFMYMQCLSSRIPFPRWAQRWINIRKIFCNAYHAQKANLLSMLENLGLAFEGHPHSGIDDARNIARILSHIITDGCNVYVNEKLFPEKMASQAVPVATEMENCANPEVVVVAQDEDDDIETDDEGEDGAATESDSPGKESTEQQETVNGPSNCSVAPHNSGGDSERSALGPGNGSKLLGDNDEINGDCAQSIGKLSLQSS